MLRATLSAVHLLIQGRVQGVGFRYFVQETAQHVGLCGWVRNLPDGSVEVFAQGDRVVLDDFVARMRKGPPLSRVEAVQPRWQAPDPRINTFDIH